MDEEAPPAWFTEMRQGDWKIGDEVTIDVADCRIGGTHGTQEQGVRGLILGLDGAGDHNVWVMFRQALRAKGMSGYYAPTELRPFDLMAHICRELGQTPAPPR